MLVTLNDKCVAIMIRKNSLFHCLSSFHSIFWQITRETLNGKFNRFCCSHIENNTDGIITHKIVVELNIIPSSIQLSSYNLSCCLSYQISQVLWVSRMPYQLDSQCIETIQYPMPQFFAFNLFMHTKTDLWCKE